MSEDAEAQPETTPAQENEPAPLRPERAAAEPAPLRPQRAEQSYSDLIQAQQAEENIDATEQLDPRLVEEVESSTCTGSTLG